MYPWSLIPPCISNPASISTKHSNTSDASDMTQYTMDLDDQPTFLHLCTRDALPNSAPDLDLSFLRDVSKRLRDSLKLQHGSELVTVSEEWREAKYGCPPRSKQLAALRHSMQLLAERTRRGVVSATGEGLVL